MTAYAGFDTFAHPGDATMAWLRKNTNLRWVGFYLSPAPSHSDKTWMSKRAALVAGGWGIAPVYVGQQVTGPGGHKVTGAQGTLDGGDAVFLMLKAGFPVGSCVYLDLENGAPLGTAQRAYVVAWAAEVTKRGFLPGVYCSYQMATTVHNVVPNARIWVFHVKTTAKHVVSGPTYSTGLPSLSGYAGATIWQHDDEASIAIDGGKRLQVDLDTSFLADPSAPAVAIVPPPVPAPVITVTPPAPVVIPPAPPAPPVPKPSPLPIAPVVQPTFWQRVGAWLGLI